MTADPIALTPKQVDAMKRRLQIANARLIAMERKWRELKDNMKTLATQLKRAEGRTES
jgi:hypothetical protein